LRVQDFKPSASQQQSLQQSLSTQGYQWRAEGDAWLMQVNAPAEAKP
jgi:general secretion pathway protein L